MQLRLRGSRRHAEHLGDLFVFVAFNVVQEKNAARSGGQASDRLLEIEHIARCQRHSDDTCVRVHSACFVIVLLESRSLPPIALPCVEHDVDCQSMQPSPERALAPEEMQLLPRTDEDILRQLLRATAISDHADAERENPVYVQPVEPLERTPVSSRRSRDV